jgi:hypothetical protein
MNIFPNPYRPSSYPYKTGLILDYLTQIAIILVLVLEMSSERL